MSPTSPLFIAPRRRRRPGAIARLWAVALLALVPVLLHPASGMAQVVPDSLALDSLALDTLELDLDTIPVPQEGDSVSADTIFYNLPLLDAGAPEGWNRGVWTWDHEAIMADGAVTLAELVDEVPGLVTLLGGDYGTPVTLSAFGSGGGGYRIIRDGFEVMPLTGGVMDLQRVGLAGIHHVRLERGLGGMLIFLRSHQYDDGRPYSLVEAGTGVLDTNFFRGSFADPVALGGSVAVALEREDTQGPRGEEAGDRSGPWLRYQYHRGDDTGLALELRRMSNTTEVSDYVSPTTRTDWVVRGRHRLSPALVAELYTGNASYTQEDARVDEYGTEGGSVSQSGVRLSFDKSGLWARGAYRMFGGDLPSGRLDLTGGLTREGVGGVWGGLQRASWSETSTSAVSVNAWTEPFFGLSLFGSWESGTFGARAGALQDAQLPPDSTATDTTTVVDPPADSTELELPLPLFGVTDRTAFRVGAQLQWGGAVLSGAYLRTEADSLLPLGLIMDRGQPLLPGAQRTGWEVWGTLPLPVLHDLRLTGSVQRWDAVGPYLPEQIYRGALEYHFVNEAGTLERWFSLGVRGRGPMPLFAPPESVLDEETDEESMVYADVPFFQSWYARLQIRVVSLSIFIGWENFARRPNLQDFPERILPITRSVYGIRWTLWN